MNRLTNFSGDGFLICYECFKPQCRNCTELKKQASKLAEYENTELEPNEILTGLELAILHAALEQLKRYEQLILEGRLLELPCKVGGAVYVIYSAEVEYGGKAVIEYCTVSEISTHRIWIENNSKAFKYYDIGKIVFLTLAEAEKALEVLNNDKTN